MSIDQNAEVRPPANDADLRYWLENMVMFPPLHDARGSQRYWSVRWREKARR